MIVYVNSLELYPILNNVGIYSAITSWDKVSAFPKVNYFNQPCKANEQELYNVMTTDAFNKFGVKLMYYPVSYNTSFDKVFGEDRNRFIERAFKIAGYTEELKQEDTSYSIAGITLKTVNKFYISITHFDDASTYNYNTSGYYPSLKILPGDIIRTIYSGIFWEVVNVTTSVNRFLNSTHVYTVIVKVYTDDKITLRTNSPTLLLDPITSVCAPEVSATIPFDDYLAINNDIDTLKITILYDDPLGD